MTPSSAAHARQDLSAAPAQIAIETHDGQCVDEFVGTYENHEYDDDGKNAWHFVTLTRIDCHTLKWTNRAGVSWTLFATASPQELRVGEDCPYFDDGHRFATVRRNYRGDVVEILGPWGEPYTRD